VFGSAKTGLEIEKNRFSSGEKPVLGSAKTGFGIEKNRFWVWKNRLWDREKPVLG